MSDYHDNTLFLIILETAYHNTTVHHAAHDPSDRQHVSLNKGHVYCTQIVNCLAKPIMLVKHLLYFDK